MAKALNFEISLPVVRVSKVLADRLNVEAFDKSAPLSRVIRDRLEHSFAIEGDVLPRTARDNAGQRKLDLDNQIREFELAKLKGEQIKIDDAVAVVIDHLHAIKQSNDGIIWDLPDATDEQRAFLKERVEKLFADIVASAQDRVTQLGGT